MCCYLEYPVLPPPLLLAICNLHRAVPDGSWDLGQFAFNYDFNCTSSEPNPESRSPTRRRPSRRQALLSAPLDVVGRRCQFHAVVLLVYPQASGPAGRIFDLDFPRQQAIDHSGRVRALPSIKISPHVHKSSSVKPRGAHHGHGAETRRRAIP